MDVIEVATTPNPNARKFVLDTKLAAGFNVTGADQPGNAFTDAVFAAGGVAAVFAVNDFVTVTRTADTPWDAIEAAVRAAVGLL
jgi:hypothetical protein